MVTVPAIGPLDEGNACFVDTTVAASASSPIGLPVALTYAVDDFVGALPGPTATATLWGVGPHEITVFASDTLGATTRATETVTVTGAATCQ